MMEIPVTPPVVEKKRNSQIYLNQALIELLKTTSYDKITVKSLTQKAGISRAAFYAQYEDKNQFVNSFVDYILSQQFCVSFGNLPAIPNRFSQGGFTSYYTRLFQHIEANKEMYTLLMSEKGIPRFRSQFRKMAVAIWRYKHFEDLEHYLIKTPNIIKAEILVEYVISGHIATIDYWLFQNPQLSASEVTEHMMELTWTIIKSTGLQDV